jgi:Ulp1 family protease
MNVSFQKNCFNHHRVKSHDHELIMELDSDTHTAHVAPQKNPFSPLERNKMSTKSRKTFPSNRKNKKKNPKPKTMSALAHSTGSEKRNHERVAFIVYK